MDEQKQTIFRKSALDRLQSPDDLNDYIRVTTPKTWLLIAAAAAILVGFAIWGFFGSVEIVNANGTVEQTRPITFLLER